MPKKYESNGYRTVPAAAFEPRISHELGATVHGKSGGQLHAARRAAILQLASTDG